MSSDNARFEIIMLKGGTDNCYLITNGKEAVLFDTSSGPGLDMVMQACSKYDMKLIVLSHPHFDHAENADAISRRFNIPVAYHENDDEIFDDYNSQPLKSYGLVGFVVLKLSIKQLSKTNVVRPENRFFIKEGDTLESFGFPGVRAVELPGHTNGSIGLLVEEHSLLAGDALDNWIKPGMGHLYCDLDAQKKTCERIKSFGERKIYYGHGKPTVGF